MNNHLYATTVLKAFDILDCFKDDQQELGISDIAALVELPASSVHRLIQSLEFEGFLCQNRENKKYALGMRLLSLNQKCKQYSHFLQIAAKYVDELGRRTGETVNLATCGGDRITNVYRAESHFVLRPNYPLNTPYPAHSTGVGRVFLSEMSRAGQRWVYEANQETIGISFDAFAKMLLKIRQDGYALDDEAFTAGLRCAAAPIRASNGVVVFAISISAPLARMDDAGYENARQLVIGYAERISRAIQAFETGSGF